jgi:ABC-type nickel/cobalt efflux system permease component RcnA
MGAWLTVIGAILSIVIGLWKFFRRKASKEQKRKEGALNEAKHGIDNKDPSEITGGIDSLNWH